MKNKRIQSLQGLRALAFMDVFCVHAAMPFTLGTGAWGVSVFIMLSGFGLVYAYYARPEGPVGGIRFSARKIWKLYGLHLVTMVLYAMVKLEKSIFYDGLPQYLADVKPLIPINLLLLQSWFPDSRHFFSFNCVSWFLSTSAFLYFCFPRILKWVKTWNSNRTAWICLGASVGASVGISALAWYLVKLGVPATHHYITYIFPPFRLPDFMVGCCLGYLFLHREEKAVSTWKYHAAELGTVALILVCKKIYYSPMKILSAEWVQYTVLFIVPSALILWLTANARGIVSRFLQLKWVVKLGDLSAYLFLIHYVVISAIRDYMECHDISRDTVGKQLAYSLLCLAVSLVLSQLWSLGVQWLHRAKKSLTAQKV